MTRCTVKGTGHRTLAALAIVSCLHCGSEHLNPVPVEPSCPPTAETASWHAWSRAIGATIDGGVQQLVLDESGQLLISGWFEGALDLGCGQRFDPGVAFFLAKLGPDASCKWMLVRRRSGFESGHTMVPMAGGDTLVAAHSGGTFALGETVMDAVGSSDIFLVVLDPEGVPRWTKQLGDEGYQNVQDAAVTGDGGVVLAGSFVGVMDLGGQTLAADDDGGMDTFLIKLDATGEHVWSYRYDSTHVAWPSIEVASDGHLMLALGVRGSIDIGDGPLELSAPEAVLLARLAPDGTVEAFRQLPESGNATARVTAVDSQGRPLIVGGVTEAIDLGGGPIPFAGHRDAFVASFDRELAYRWSDTVGTTGQQSAVAFARFGPDDRATVAGFVHDLPHADEPKPSYSFLRGYDDMGEQLFEHRFGCSQHSALVQAAADAQGDIYLAGYFQGSFDLGGGPLPSNGGTDGFFAKLSPP